MKLLFLCQTFPYPPDGGVWIRSFNILRLLAERFDVTLLAFERAVTERGGYRYDPEHGIAQLSKIAETEVFRIPQRHSRLRFLADHLRSVLLQQPFTRFLYDSMSFRERLEELLCEGFDVVHVDSMDLSTYLPLVEHLPVLCTHHNVESELLHRRRRIEANPLVRAYLDLQARLTRQEERQWCERVDLNLTVSKDDLDLLRKISPDGHYAVVPNGVDVKFFRPDRESEERGLVFVGGTNWFPNRDALGYFCEDILPKLRKKHSSIPIRWIGAASEDDRSRFQREHEIELTGYVEDMRPLVHEARCYVVPIRVGGGSRLKILDAWAMGKAVVSTSIGCEGLNAIHEENILIADNPRAFASAVDRVLRDDDLRERLGRRARKTAVDEYSWEAIGRRMIPMYQAVREGRVDEVSTAGS